MHTPLSTKPRLRKGPLEASSSNSLAGTGGGGLPDNDSRFLDTSVFGAGGSGAPDLSNPFIAPVHPKSRSTSPTKPTSTTRKENQAPTQSHSLGSLRKSMGNMDVVGSFRSGAGATREGGDEHHSMGASSSSKPTMGQRGYDRFIPQRPSSADSSFPSLAQANTSVSGAGISHGSTSSTSNLSDNSISNTSGADLSASLGVPAPHTRILSFHSAPPPSQSRNPHASAHLDLSRQYVQSGLDPRNAHNTPGGSKAGSAKRRIPTMPERVLDAPGFVNDYYLNLLNWSCTNKVAIGLGSTAYVWDADSGGVSALGGSEEDSAEMPAICSLSWAPDGAYLAVGNETGDVEIWDAEAGVKMRTMSGHLARVATLSWNGSVLSSGCRDGSIHHHDVRIARHKIQELKGHRAEVCGLTWRADGQLLASGGNDNVVNCWDNRIGMSVLGDGENQPSVAPKWQKTSHVAAVKALAWCPWQSSLLASGGGTSDQTIHFWSSTTGARLSSLPTTSQVTSLIWSNHSKEIMSTHGFPDHSVNVWSYPSLTRVGEIKQAHDERILASAVSPDGCTVVTAASDENLKFWKLWEAKAVSKKGIDKEDAFHSSSSAGSNTNRPRPQMWR